jgi:hypothetical protein
MATVTPITAALRQKAAPVRSRLTKAEQQEMNELGRELTRICNEFLPSLVCAPSSTKRSRK